MPKLKTHKGAAKRFKKTGTGKVARTKAYARHLLTSKSRSRTRNLPQSLLADAAAQAKDDLPCTDLVADLLDGIPGKRLHRPGFLAFTDTEEKVLQHLLPFMGVYNLRVELEPVKVF